MAIILDGNAGISFNDSTSQNTSAIISGKLPTNKLPVGTVIQTVYGSTTSTLGSTTGSGGAEETGLSASITPTSSSSKILVITHQPGSGKNTAADSLYAELVRDSTVIAQQNRFTLTDNNSTANFDNLTFSVLDSPATTSATTYKVRARRQGSSGVGYVNVDSNLCTIILMEIAS